jgi:glycerate 2-kinase
MLSQERIDVVVMKKIKNAEKLLSHGDIESRKIVLDIADRTLQRLDSYERIKSIARMEGSTLHIGTRSWDLEKKRNVYLFGAGKACNHMAMAIDEVLGDYLTKGIAIVKIAEESDLFRNTEVIVGGHPLPNESGYRASKKIIEIVDQSGPDDLFIVVISGGSSALMSCPIDGISLQDEIDTTDIMLKSGAGIYEVNAVRRHISRLNGGMLAKKIQDVGAELIGLGISDAVGSPGTTDIGVPYDKYTSTPIGPDMTTLEDARNVIRNRNVEDRLPKSVVDYLMNVGPEGETPKSFPDNTYFLINTLPDSCLYAKEVCEEMGLPVMILSSFLEGESKDAGTYFASIAKEIQAYGNPIKPPCVVLSSGETTTEILDNSKITGHGGPGQELTASFAIAAAKTKGACMFSIDSEGTDGTTSVAGGITDSKSYATALEKDVDLFSALRGHACYEALTEIGDAVFTGNTGTNLCDLNIMYIPEVKKDRIVSVKAQQIIDCKCRPAVEVEVVTESGARGRGSCPTGSSVGMYEAHILRDNDPNEYGGLSVNKAVSNVNDIIAAALIGVDVADQRVIDQKMIALDGTSEKKNLGGNAIYSASIACFRAAADSVREPLYKYIAGGDLKTVPIPSFNVVNGGHYKNLTQPFNEFIIMPYKADDIDEAVEIGVAVFQELNKVLEDFLGEKPQVASSYGYAAPSEDPEVILSLIQQAIDNCGYTEKVAFSLDCASSEMYDKETNTYLLKGERISSDELIAYTKTLTEKYNFVFVEDLLDENDWDGYVKAVKELTRTIILGDDLTVTNADFLKKAHELRACDGFILKPNQVGTITEALDAYKFAQEHQMIAVPSGRSGGVVDDVVMDFSTGLHVPFQKNGAPRSGERIEKLNFLMRACDSSPGCKLMDISGLIKF